MLLVAKQYSYGGGECRRKQSLIFFRGNQSKCESLEINVVQVEMHTDKIQIIVALVG